MVTIRPMLEQDIGSVSMLHSEAFRRQLASKKWITCNFMAYPRILMYVAVNEKNKIIGFIQWLQKSGFRKESVIELEQIAVLPEFQGMKVGTELIERSLGLVTEYLVNQNSVLKVVLVTTRSDNYAQRLYEKTLNAKISACITDLYSADEVVMLARFD